MLPALDACLHALGTEEVERALAAVPRMTLSSCYWSLWESVRPVNAPSHLPGTSLDPEASLGFLCRS